MDHDWVYRQLVLYDMGKLERFCRHRATADLLAGADDMQAWSRAPIDVYRLLERRPDSITWLRERDDELLRTPNAGCAIDAVAEATRCSACVVPTGGEQIFESEPLPVTDAVATRVAADPDNWLAALGEWDLYRDVVPLTRPTEHAGLLVELPPRIWQNVVCDQPETTRSPPSHRGGGDGCVGTRPLHARRVRATRLPAPRHLGLSRGGVHRARRRPAPGRPRGPGAAHTARTAGRSPVRAGRHRVPTGGERRPATGRIASSTERRGGLCPSGNPEARAGSRPPFIELVEMPAGSAPSLRCGGLDRLDQRVVARCLPCGGFRDTR